MVSMDLAGEREQCEAGAGRDVPGQADHLCGGAVTLVRVERSRLVDADELRGVLADDRGGGNGIRGLVALSLGQRRAVDRGEEREAQAHDQERDRDRGAAGISRERECGEADESGPPRPARSSRRGRKPSALAATTAAMKTTRPGRRSRIAPVPFPPARLAASVAPRANATATTTAAAIAAKSSVVRRSAPSRTGGAHTDPSRIAPRGENERKSNRETAAREDGMRDDGAAGRAEVLGDEYGRPDPGKPAHGGSGRRNRSRLGP